ncbi:DMT family transporter [Salinifilum aidingensis]
MNGGQAVLSVAVPTAVLGAASFGLASAVQHRVTKQVPAERTLNPKLLVDLIRKPIWVISVLTVIVGLSLQVVSLAYGPLVLVQPLLVTSVLFGAAFAAWMAHRRLDAVLVVGALACSGGLAAFLLLSRPSGAGHALTADSLLPLALLLGAVVVAALVFAQMVRGELGAVALALATGVFYGVTAALMKVVAGQVRSTGLAEPFLHPMLYVVCVIGPMGFLLSQQTFQRSRVISPALAVITTVDPLVSAAIGVRWLGEHVHFSTGILAGEVVAILAIVVGVVVLAHRGEQLRAVDENRGQGSTATWG